MKLMWFNIAFSILVGEIYCFWDMGTTTISRQTKDTLPRRSFFRWMEVINGYMKFWYWNYDWYEIEMRRRLCVVAGLSIRKLTLGTGTLLNKRTVLTSANLIDEYAAEENNLRVWALSRIGAYDTPWRYRVWRVSRLFPKSLNPEHWHGPRGIHSPRHDVAIIHTLDQMYIASQYPYSYQYPYKAWMPTKHMRLSNDLWMGGSGFVTLENIRDNYKIIWKSTNKASIMDCSRYLPKWWGKFICLNNFEGFPGIQNGMGLYSGRYVVGLGCFEIRYNEERILVFTDLRYYVDYIYQKAHTYPGEYYEYAYPQWFAQHGTFKDSSGNQPTIPGKHIQYDVYPMGKKK